MTDLSNEGAIKFWLRHPDETWAKNAKNYSFPPCSEQGVSVTAAKVKSRIEVSVTIPERQPIQMGGKIPNDTLPNAVMITVTWKGPTVSLYLNKSLVSQWVPPESNVTPFKK